MKHIKAVCAVVFVLILLAACKKECAHEYVTEITRAPTCNQPGEEQYTCIHCEESYTAQLPAKDHTYLDAVEQRPATCAEEGQLVYTCTDCAQTKIEEIPALEHRYGEGTVQKEPTCGEPGILAFRCEQCNAVKEEEIPTLEHTFGELVLTKEPNCTEQGELSAVCEVCGHAELKEYVPVNGEHSMQENVKKASTCLEQGYGEMRCSYCGYAEEVTYGLSDHSYGDYVTVQEATCSAAGAQERTCGVCGYVEQKAVEQLAHTWDQQVCNKPITCTVCGYYNASGMTHEYEYYATYKPSNEAAGVRVYACIYCGAYQEKYFGAYGDYDLSEVSAYGAAYARELGFEIASSYSGQPTAKTEVKYRIAEYYGGESYLKEAVVRAVDRVYNSSQVNIDNITQYSIYVQIRYIGSYNQNGATGVGYFLICIYVTRLS